MKKSEIKVGGRYLAKVNGKVVTVRVDAIREKVSASSYGCHRDVYAVTNLATGRKTTFCSAAKFRSEETPEQAVIRTGHRVKEITKKKAEVDAVMASLEEAEQCSDPLHTQPSVTSSSTPPATGVGQTGSKENPTSQAAGSSQGGEQGPDPTARKSGTSSTENENSSRTARPAASESQSPPVQSVVSQTPTEDEQCSDPTSGPTSVPAAAGGSPATATNEEGKQCSDPTLTGSQGNTGSSSSSPTAAPSCELVKPQQPTNPPSSPGAAAAKPAGSLASRLRERAIDGAKEPGGCPHVVVVARAGTGKTTTLVEGLKVVKGLPTSITPSPQQAAVWEQLKLSQGRAKSICFVAFNKSIADELRDRVPAGCDAMTMHSMGNRAVYRMFGRQELTAGAVEEIVLDLLGIGPKPVESEQKTPSAIREYKKTLNAWYRKREAKMVTIKLAGELVSLCKQNLVGPCVRTDNRLVPYAEEDTWEGQLDQLTSRHDVDLNGSKAEVYGLVPRVLEACKTPKGKISFDDMIWLPVIHDLPVFCYDLLLVDEAQDLNRCQQALAKKAGKRLVLCGDDRQAIYGFAGADSESLYRMEAELGQTNQGVVVLPLTVTRRCGKAIVREAQRYVQDFEAHESNGEGKITEAAYADAVGNLSVLKPHYTRMVEDGDMVLCRCNAPLVSQCFKFLRAGRKANIQGRDVAKGLISTLEEMKASTVPDLIAKLGDWLHREQAKENAERHPSETKLQGLQDRHDCLVCFAEAAETIDQVKAKIESIFTDDKKSPGIRLSSIHKAKGLEAKRVFILVSDGKRPFGPPPDKLQDWELGQEDNLRYVAITRAIEELVYVG